MTTYASQNFDGVTAPALPSGVTGSAGSSWATSTNHPVSSPNSVFNNATDAGAAYFLGLDTIAGSADAVTYFDFYIETANTVPYAVVRAVSRLTPLSACYAADFQVTGGAVPGVHISKDGFSTNLASLNGNFLTTATAYRGFIQADSNNIRVAVWRRSDGKWMQTDGSFGTSSAWALQTTDSTFSSAGYGDCGVYQPNTGRVYFDNLRLDSASTLPPDPGTTPTGDLINADIAAIHYSTNVVRKPGDGTVILMENGTSGRFSLATGTTDVYAKIDTTALSAVTTANPSGFPTTSWPNFYYQVDGGARQGPVQIQPTATIIYITIATGLSNSVPHRIQFWYEEISGQDTYNQTLYAILDGFIVTTGGSIIAPAGAVSDPAGGTGIAFGNSIGWGSQGLPIGQNSVFQRFMAYLASGLNINLGVVGKPGQGLVTNAAGSPIASGPFGKDSWKRYDSGHIRDYPQTLDWIFLEWGTNDTTDITSQVTTTTQELRAAYGTRPKIVWLVPIAGSHASQIAAGVTAAGDTLTKNISWGGTFPDPGNSGASSPDGTHPNAAYHMIIGSAFAQKTAAAYSTGGTTTTIAASSLLLTI